METLAIVFLLGILFMLVGKIGQGKKQRRRAKRKGGRT